MADSVSVSTLSDHIETRVKLIKRREEECVLPIQYTVQPMGSDDRIFPHSCHILNNESNVGADTACKYRSI